MHRTYSSCLISAALERTLVLVVVALSWYLMLLSCGRLRVNSLITSCSKAVLPLLIFMITWSLRILNVHVVEILIKRVFKVLLILRATAYLLGLSLVCLSYRNLKASILIVEVVRRGSGVDILRGANSPL